MPLLNLFGININTPTIPELPGLSNFFGGLGRDNALGESRIPFVGPTNAGATQQFSIERFRQNLNKHNETARADKFDVYIAIPNGINAAGIAAQASLGQLALQCEVSELPGRDIQMVEYRVHAFIHRVPHMNQYGAVNFTFICTGDFWEKQFFDAWMDTMLPAQTGLANYPEQNGMTQYESDIVINQYDLTGALIYSVKLINALPVSVTPLQQSWDNDAIHKLNVTFQFRKWLSVQTTSNQTMTFNGANPSILPNASSGIVSTDPTAPTNATTDQRTT